MIAEVYHLLYERMEMDGGTDPICSTLSSRYLMLIISATITSETPLAQHQNWPLPYVQDHQSQLLKVYIR